MQLDTIWYNVIQRDTTWYNVIQLDTKWYNLIQLDTTWYNLIQLLIRYHFFKRFSHCITLYHCIRPLDTVIRQIWENYMIHKDTTWYNVIQVWYNMIHAWYGVQKNKMIRTDKQVGPADTLSDEHCASLDSIEHRLLPIGNVMSDRKRNGWCKTDDRLKPRCRSKYGVVYCSKGFKTS